MRPIVLLTVMWLSACATGNSSAAVCPFPVPYTAQEQADAAADLSLLKAARPQSPLIKMITDYATERQELRDCRN